jgi:hypothetical protein
VTKLTSIFEKQSNSLFKNNNDNIYDQIYNQNSHQSTFREKQSNSLFKNNDNDINDQIDNQNRGDSNRGYDSSKSINRNLYNQEDDHYSSDINHNTQNSKTIESNSSQRNIDINRNITFEEMSNVKNNNLATSTDQVDSQDINKDLFKYSNNRNTDSVYNKNNDISNRINNNKSESIEEGLRAGSNDSTASGDDVKAGIYI